MRRALQLAQLGAGRVSPNPLVGSVIVKGDTIIGEGWHQKAGQPHAEVNAIRSVKNPKDLINSRIYVNLEPCAHFGKTPPCSDLIIEMKIPEVIIGCVDPYSEVAGKGIEKLKKAGVNVTVGVLEKEALHINRRFFTYHTQKRPYIILKWAESIDGFMDIDRSSGEKGSVAISGPAAKRVTHRWRSEEDAILIGAKTLRTDNPSLNVREVSGQSPIPIVVSKSGNLPVDSHLVKNPKAIIYSDQELNWKSVFDDLYQRGIQSVLVEGGRKIHQSLLDEGWVDEVRIWTSDKILNSGLSAPKIDRNGFSSTCVGKDLLLIKKVG